MDIVHYPVFYLKHNVSETAFCLHLQVELTQLAPKDRDRLGLRQGANWVGSTCGGDRIQSTKRHVLNKRQDHGKRVELW
jgi:hypothetical protein